MSDLMRCLLDKVTARRVMEGLLKLAEARNLTEEELFALDLYERANTEGIRLFIVPPTDNVLRRLESLPRYSAIIHLFRNRTEVVQPARYFKRWARRLRDHGFTREDAAVLALATFGTSKDAGVLGMHCVATLDQPMIRQWAAQKAAIRKRLATMQRNLPAPYRHASLPQVRRPEHIVV
ncbi:MAG: hypothetical protein ACE5HA_17370 [Anaerolineae bacterium]